MKKDYVKRTKWGYEVWSNKKQIGAGVGLNLFQFIKIQLPTNKLEKQMAKKGIFFLAKR